VRIKVLIVAMMWLSSADRAAPIATSMVVGCPPQLSLADARKKLEDWREYYNEERPHGAIGQKTPITLLNHDGAASPPS
jgi:hypothetical protein